MQRGLRHEVSGGYPNLMMQCIECLDAIPPASHCSGGSNKVLPH